LIDPPRTATGRRGVEQLAAVLRVEYPVYSFVRVGGVERSDGHVRFGWKFVDPGGTTAVVGTDVGLLASDSHFAIGRDRPDHPIPLRILGGSLEIDARPERSMLRAVLAGPDVATFVGQPTSVEPDRHGLSVWRIAGTLVHGDDADPMRVTVAYHGVFRSRGRAWAWFSGSGALETSGRRSWWRRAPRVDRRLVVLELLLDTPRRFAPSEV
jgi:hypothetical protein